jgi:hypothetical protein
MGKKLNPPSSLELDRDKTDALFSYFNRKAKSGAVSPNCLPPTPSDSLEISAKLEGQEDLPAQSFGIFSLVASDSVFS